MTSMHTPPASGERRLVEERGERGEIREGREVKKKGRTKGGYRWRDVREGGRCGREGREVKKTRTEKGGDRWREVREGGR